MIRRVAALLAGSLLIGACSPGAREAEPFEGIWQSEGWGTFLLIQGGDVEIFEHSAAHCLSVATGGARGIGEVLSFEGDRLVMRDSDREIRFDPIEVLPIQCADASGSNDPEIAVEVLVTTIEEQYIGDLDSGWQGRQAEVVTRAGGADERTLFDLMTGLLEPLGLGVGIGVGDEIWPPLPLFDPPGGLETGGAGGFAAGMLEEGVGYLGLARVGPFASNAAESERLAGEAIDAALRGDAVILDLRAAAGGVIGDALLIATRIVPEAGEVARLEARAGDGVVAAGSLTVAPVPTGTFDGDVYVLVGPETRGVAELLAHVLGEMDSVTTIGAATFGDPSPPLIRFLPNGWSFAVPNLRVVGPDGAHLGAVLPDVEAIDPLAEAIRLAG